MNGVIPNPKKTIEIDFSIEQIKGSIEYIPYKNNKYKFYQKNEVINLYSFHGMEFLSLGVYIDIHLSSINESRTKIDIEVRRTMGAFDKPSEINKANDHIQNITKYISECVVLSNEELHQLKESTSTSNSDKKKGASWKLATIFIVSSIVFFFIFKLIFKKEEEEKTYCDCYKWGKELSIKETEALIGTSDQMKKFEQERDQFREECNEKMNPKEMSETKKMLEEIKKCK